MHNNNKFYLSEKNAKNTIAKVKEKGKGKRERERRKREGGRSSNGIVTF